MRRETEFARLFVRHEPVLRAFARSLLPRWELVDEAIQEASITLWQKFDELDSPDHFLSWARAVVRYKCLSEIGRMGRDKHVFCDELINRLAEEAEPLDAVRVEAQMAALMRCLAGLPEHHRQLVLAPYAGHGRLKEIAQERGCSQNAIYKLLARLRGGLSRCVKEGMAKDAASGELG